MSIKKVSQKNIVTKNIMIPPFIYVYIKLGLQQGANNPKYIQQKILLQKRVGDHTNFSRVIKHKIRPS